MLASPETVAASCMVLLALASSYLRSEGARFCERQPHECLLKRPYSNVTKLHDTGTVLERERPVGISVILDVDRHRTVQFDPKPRALRGYLVSVPLIARIDDTGRRREINDATRAVCLVRALIVDIHG